ncbi:hypothetical protein [Pseudoxanthomonas suwonensis]|uniref:hypothetical protein n=1 Tax=Pseudoxanthomonas suwonensis TaxID=314722 RepID=UPI000ADD2BEE|nr:hypothetical protein [Pseudoxanthomonas suwonensis]
MRLFLDAEWADATGTELVRLALVSKDGRRKLYVERDPLPPAGSDFVGHVVYPLLERGWPAMPDLDLAERVRAFLDAAGVPEVLADHPNDFALLRRVLAQAAAPVEWGSVLVDQSDVWGHIETYFDRPPGPASIPTPCRGRR